MPLDPEFLYVKQNSNCTYRMYDYDRKDNLEIRENYMLIKHLMLLIQKSMFRLILTALF